MTPLVFPSTPHLSIDGLELFVTELAHLKRTLDMDCHLILYWPQEAAQYRGQDSNDHIGNPYLLEGLGRDVCYGSDGGPDDLHIDAWHGSNLAY